MILYDLSDDKSYKLLAKQARLHLVDAGVKSQQAGRVLNIVLKESFGFLASGAESYEEHQREVIARKTIIDNTRGRERHWHLRVSRYNGGSNR